MDQNYWDSQLQKFRDAKKKSTIFSELLTVTESILEKLKSLSIEKENEITELKKQNAILQTQVKDLRDELEIAWDQNS